MDLTTASPTLQEYILQFGVQQPPTGVEVEFGPAPRIMDCERWVILLTTLIPSTIFLALRLYTKLFVRKRFQADDALLVIGFLLYVAFQVEVFKSIETGVGQDLWNVQVWMWMEDGKILNISAIVYMAASWAIKTSILLQYLTIFVPDRKQNRALFIASWSAIAFLTLFTIISICITTALCIPREKIWNPFINGHCINFSPIAKMTGVGNIVIDVLVFAIPIQATWKLQMTTRHKLSVCAVFSAGIFGIVASSVRTYYTWIYPDGSNQSRGLYYVGLWTLLELTAGFIIGNSFVIPQLLRNIRNALTSRKSSDNSYPRPSATISPPRSWPESTSKKPFLEEITPYSAHELSNDRRHEITSWLSEPSNENLAQNGLP